MNNNFVEIQKIKKSLIEILNQECNIDVGDNESIELLSLGINSITYIKFVVSIEKYFGFDFDDENLDYTKFKYLEEISNYIFEILNKK